MENYLVSSPQKKGKMHCSMIPQFHFYVETKDKTNHTFTRIYAQHVKSSLILSNFSSKIPLINGTEKQKSLKHQIFVRYLGKFEQSEYYLAINARIMII